MLPENLATSFSSELSPDRPINNPDEDQFHRDTLVRRLSQALLNSDASQGLVIGFDAPWGYGKTSLKNMVVKRLKESTDSKVTIVEFEPWMYSDTGEVVSALFRTIAQELSTLRAKTMFWNLKRVGSFILNFASEVLDAAVSNGATGGLAGRVTGYALAKGFKSLAKIMEPNSTKGTDKLRSIRENLRKNLQKEKDKRIIVFIDDIDRLADDEISALFRAVKSVGDLPNVIYVLLYDRHKVAAALARDQKDNGDKFLEKIVQVPIKVPEPSESTIRTMVENGLAKLKKCDNRSTPSGRRAHAILNNCITSLISSPREVHLLLNKTGFYYASMGDEVEFYDLAGITGIECFCPKLYSWIQDNRILLCDGRDPNISSNTKKLELETLIKKSDEYLSAEYKDWEQLVASLFPYFASIYEGKAPASRKTDPSYRFIYNREYVNSYFTFNNAISNSPEFMFYELFHNKDLNALEDTYVDIAFNALAPTYIKRYTLDDWTISENRFIKISKFYFNNMPPSSEYQSARLSSIIGSLLNPILCENTPFDRERIIETYLSVDGTGAFFAKIHLAVELKLRFIRLEKEAIEERRIINTFRDKYRIDIQLVEDQWHVSSKLLDLKPYFFKILESLKSNQSTKDSNQWAEDITFRYTELLRVAIILSWLFEEDEETFIDTLCKLKQYATCEYYCIIISAVLTELENGFYKVKLENLKRVIDARTFVECVDSLFAKGENNNHEIIDMQYAAAVLLKLQDEKSSVSEAKVNQFLKEHHFQQ